MSDDEAPCRRSGGDGDDPDRSPEHYRRIHPSSGLANEYQFFEDVEILSDIVPVSTGSGLLIELGVAAADYPRSRVVAQAYAEELIRNTTGALRAFWANFPHLSRRPDTMRGPARRVGDRRCR